jgi:hypothetical protein
MTSGSHSNSDDLFTVAAAGARTGAPAWATEQRKLIDDIDRAAPLFLKAHTLEDGGLLRHGKLDDDYECFKDWPLFYAIGGSEEVFAASLRSWEAVTRQWTEKGEVDREFICSGHTDMLHISEGYVGFQYFGLANPDNERNIDRARRFASFYTGEDPHARNYDSEHRVMRSPFTGSRGPALDGGSSTFAPQGMLELSHRWASLYPVVVQPEVDSELPEIGALADKLITRSDCAMNLAVTGLVTNAYLYTGEEKYKSWVLEYVGKWIECTAENGGLVPDNLGPGGKIGEHRQGQWWGGFFGWQCIYSVEMISKALTTASECACIVSGDTAYLGLLRSFIDALLERSTERDGALLVPHRMGPDGWYDYKPLAPSIAGHLWHNSLDADDWARLERLRNGAALDWNHVENDTGHTNLQRLNDAPHLTYLGGTNPEWPQKILAADSKMVERNANRIRGGSFEKGSQTVLDQSPVLPTGLAQMTMAAPYTCFNGGLLRGQVRYFDADRARPGLPLDVAALVETVTAESISLHLVNLSASETRKLIIQAGPYGEHSFTDVTVHGGDTPRETFPANARHVAIELPPATTTSLDLGTDRFVNRPTYDFPRLD